MSSSSTPHTYYRPNIPWVQQVFPKGIPLYQSLLISGPGGSGKPIIAYELVSDWLKHDGAVILFLTSTTYEYTQTIFQVFEVDLQAYLDKQKLLLVEFDPTLSEPEQLSPNRFRANFLYPEHWTHLLDLTSKLDLSQQGLLFVATALNLLYFSPTYRSKIHEFLLGYLQDLDESQHVTPLWTLNSQAHKSFIKQLEDAADSLLISSMDKSSMQLFVRLEKSSDQSIPPSYFSQDVLVPIPPATLKTLRQEAERGRNKLIPMLRKI